MEPGGVAPPTASKSRPYPVVAAPGHCLGFRSLLMPRAAIAPVRTPIGAAAAPTKPATVDRSRDGSIAHNAIGTITIDTRHARNTIFVAIFTSAHPFASYEVRYCGIDETPVDCRPTMPDIAYRYSQNAVAHDSSARYRGAYRYPILTI